MSIIPDPAAIPQHLHPAWCPGRRDGRPGVCVSTLGADGTRELVHDRAVLDDGHVELYLVSVQQIDERGAVRTERTVIHLAAEGPLTAHEARQLAGALGEAAELLGGAR